MKIFKKNYLWVSYILIFWSVCMPTKSEQIVDDGYVASLEIPAEAILENSTYIKAEKLVSSKIEKSRENTISTLASLNTEYAKKTTSPVSYALPKVIAGLFSVIVLILGLSYMAKKIGIVNNLNNRQILVKDSVCLGHKEKLVVIECDGEKLLLGVTSHTITLLKDSLSIADGAKPGSSQLAANSPIDFQKKLHLFLSKGSR